MDWGKLWDDIVNFFTNNVWNIVLFFAVLLIGIIVIKLTLNLLKRIVNRSKVEKIAAGFFLVLLKFVLYLVLILILLSIIGVNINGVLTALSASVLAVGLALQTIISNVANGLVIISNKMFKKGDYIVVNGVEGSIIEINFLFVTLQTPDNKKITLPNSTIVNSSVTNVTANSTRRVQLTFDVAYETDIEVAKKVVVDAVLSDGRVLLDPAPTCRLSAMKESSIELTARFWCDTEDYWDVYFDNIELIYNELKRNNIKIPYKQIEYRERKDEVVLPVNGSGLPERVEKKRKKKVDYDLENMDIAEVIEERKKQRAKRKAESQEKRAQKNKQKKMALEAKKVNKEEQKADNTKKEEN